LTVDGKTQSAPLEILPDPRVKLASADFEKQFALSNQVYQSVSTLHGAINQIRDLKAQIGILDKRFEGDAKAQSILKMADNLATKLSAVEEKMIQVNMKGSEANLAFPNMLNEEFDTFASSVESADAAPTDQQYQIYKMLSAKLEAQMSLLDQIISTDVTSFGDAAKKENIPLLQISKGKK
jgi:seryl-tRNA synthetase